MADYTKVFNGAAKDAANATVLGADHDTEFNAIATAIATKMDKVAGAVSGNLAELDADGNLVDSGISSVYFDNVVADIDARMDTAETNIITNTADIASVTAPAAPSGHARAGWHTMWDGDAGQTAFDINANVTEIAWETIGPTGSGATNIWTAMNDMPSTARAVQLLFFVGFTQGASGFDCGIYCAPNGVTPVVDGGTMKVYANYNDGTSDTNYLAVPAIVPVDSSQIFQLYWTVTNESSILALEVYYQGYIDDYS